MKVLLVEGAHEFGGQARHVYDLAKGLAEKGHRVTVACARQEAITRLERAGIECHKMPFRSFFDVGTLVSLTKLIRTERFEIVHSHGARAGLLGRLAARTAGGCKIVHTVHTLAEDLAPGSGLAGQAARKVYRKADAWLGKGTDKIITVSEDLRKKTISSRIRPGKVVTIHSGVDMSEFAEVATAEEARHHLGLPTGCRIVGTTARFTKQKNLCSLVASARIVCAARDDVYFVLVGDGPEYERVKQVSQDLALGHKVFLPGYVKGVSSILPAFDVFALSSIWEGHPLSVLEAMAAGIPVVATRVQGIPETIVEGETGYTVPNCDPEKMAGAILQVLSDEQQAKRMGECGRDRVIAMFSLDKMLRDIETLYFDLCSYGSIGAAVGAV